MGESLSTESVEAVRKIVDSVPAPPGIKAYVTGAGPLIADQSHAGEKGVKMVTLITFLVIIVMLLFVYRSVSTVFIVLFMVMVEVAAARGVVAFLGNYGIIGLSTFANNLLVLLAIAAGTDYAIFVMGRYHEARGLGEDREQAFYTMFHGTAHVVLGSGLTIAGAMYCLSFTRLPYFQSLGAPCAVGMLVAVFAALTLGPAVLAVASFFKLLDPKRILQTRGWRRIGTAIVRWPAPILAVTIAIALIGLLALPGYTTDYDNRHYLPSDTPANVGYAAADRHFNQARLNPELLMIETDHDMRNPADFLVLDKVAKAVFHIPGIGRVQTITRPLGTPLDHSTLAFLLSAQSAGRIQTQHYQEEQAKNLLKQADELRKTMATLHEQMQVTKSLSDTTHQTALLTKETVKITEALRDDIANFDDFFRPIRSYFYWEKHCFDIPACWTLRSIFNALDGIDAVSENIEKLSANIDKLDAIQPQLVALIPPQIASQEANLQTIMSNYATTKGLNDQQEALSDNATAMGEAFDKAKNDDTFYLPPEAFKSPDFKRGLKQFMSPDGHAVRLIISHEGDPASPEGIAHINPIKQAVHEAIKGTPWEGAKVYLGGTAALYKDMRDGSNIDLMIAGIAAATLIFIIMLVITRSRRRGPGHCGYRPAFAGRLLRAFRARVAVPSRHQTALDGAGDGDHPAVGGRVGLQLAADIPVQGRDSRGAQDGHHPRHGRLGFGGDRCGSGVRRHHGLVRVRPVEGYGPGGHHDRAGSVVRHTDRALVHDTLGGHPARTLVLVATARASAAGQHDAATVRNPPGGS